jgi:hypothetical protein
VLLRNVVANRGKVRRRSPFNQLPRTFRIIESASLAGKVCLRASSSRSSLSSHSVACTPGLAERGFSRSLVGPLVADRLLLTLIGNSCYSASAGTDEPHSAFRPQVGLLHPSLSCDREISMRAVVAQLILRLGVSPAGRIRKETRFAPQFRQSSSPAGWRWPHHLPRHTTNALRACSTSVLRCRPGVQLSYRAA